jgi:hypothetical protein
MSDQIRAGGHVIGEHGWIPADLVEDEAPSLSMSNSKVELLAAAEAVGVEADESMTKAEILEALNAAE